MGHHHLHIRFTTTKMFTVKYATEWMCVLRPESQKHSPQFAMHGSVGSYIQIYLGLYFYLDKASRCCDIIETLHLPLSHVENVV